MFVRLAFRQSPRLLAHQRADFAFQVAHACFPRVVADEFVQSLIGEFDLLAERQAVFFGLARRSGNIFAMWTFSSSV